MEILFVVDVQQAMVSGEWAIADADHFLSIWTERIKRARSEGQTVLFVQNDGEEPWDDAPGHPGWELYFTPEDGERVVRKTTLDVFESNPTLADELKLAGFTSIEMIGLQSELCISSSTQGALDAGFAVRVPVGYHATMDTEHVAASAIRDEVQGKLQILGATA